MGETRGHAGRNGVRQTAAGRSPAGPGAQPPTPDPCSSAPGPRLPCPFCDPAGRELVAENELAVAFRDAYPVNPGHTLIVPRRHVATWFDATREEQLAILELADRVKAQLDAEGVRSSGTGGQGLGIGEPTTAPAMPAPSPRPPIPGPRVPDGYNLGLNCGPAAGQTVMHLHMHVIPRYRGDHPSPKGGVRWIFPKKAKYWDE